jgi:hypothetical protein
MSKRTLRPAAIGRKNWLFVGNDQGGRTAAVLFTMIASAKANCADPFAYLRDVLTRLPSLLVRSAASGETRDVGRTRSPVPRRLDPDQDHDRRGTGHGV